MRGDVAGEGGVDFGGRALSALDAGYVRLRHAHELSQLGLGEAEIEADGVELG